MGFGAVVALVGLTFGMISIKLMSIVENAQIVIIGAIGTRRLQLKQKKVVALAIGTRRYFVLRIGIVFFAKLSSMIFAAQGMYPEKAIEGATLKMMTTVQLSNRIGRAAAKHGKHAVKKIRMRYYKDKS